MKKLIVANWKMNPATAREAIALAGKIAKAAVSKKTLMVAIAPPAPFLSLQPLQKTKKLVAQDCAAERGGAYTGSISALQLRSLKVDFVIIGHSERRLAGDSDEIVRKKLQMALLAKLRPILCVGETERNREDALPKMVRHQLHSALSGVKKSLIKNIIITYEPVWAISGHGGVPDDPKHVFEVSLLIRRELYRMLGKRVASRIPILYGGSVHDKNIGVFAREGRVDGFLVGGASLKADVFARLLTEAEQAFS
jgi:triosephosphate isomerase